MSGVVMVTGSRDWTNRGRIHYGLLKAMDMVGELSVLVHGDCSGADKLAAHIADTIGIPTRPYPADWSTHGRAAGPIRNRAMLDREKPDLVLAFPLTGSKGTWDAIRAAIECGIEVWVIPERSQ